MATISRVKTWTTGDTLTASDLNAEFDSIVNAYNGGITNVNIAAGAAISASKISGTAVTLAGAETLTNKTLTNPVIATISNTGTLTLPTSTDTLVGRATTDTFTNKTLTQPIVTNNYRARVYLGTNQSVASGAATILNLNTESYDPGSSFNTGTYTYTVPRTGTYLIIGRAVFASPTDQKQYYCSIYNSGSLVAEGTYAHASGTTSIGSVATTIQALTSGNTITLRVYHDTGSNVTVTSGATITYLEIIYLSE